MSISQEVKDAILKYAKAFDLDEEEYNVLYEFGVFFADQHFDTEVVLSDWTYPKERKE